MCQSSAFFITDKGEEVIMRDVALVEPKDGEIRLVDLFGEEKIVKGRIASINLMEHRILIVRD